MHHSTPYHMHGIEASTVPIYQIPPLPHSNVNSNQNVHPNVMISGVSNGIAHCVNSHNILSRIVPSMDTRTSYSCHTELLSEMSKTSVSTPSVVSSDGNLKCETVFPNARRQLILDDVNMTQKERDKKLSAIRSKNYRERKKMRKNEEEIRKNEEIKLNVRNRKQASRKKLQRIEKKEMRNISVIAEEHVIGQFQTRVINDYLSDLAILKAKRKTKEFKEKAQDLLKQFTISQISKCTGFAPYKVYRKVNFKEKVRNEEKYVYRVTTDIKEQVAQFFLSALISYELPDMRYCEKKYMRMSLEEAYQLYKVNQDSGRIIGRSTFCKLKPSQVRTIDQTPVKQCCCDQCENFRLLILSLLRCGCKGIAKNTRKAIESSICDLSKLPDIYTNSRYTCVPTKACSFGQCKDCHHKKEKMRIIRENTKLMASNKTVTWSRWTRPTEISEENVTVSKKNSNSTEQMLKKMILVEKSGTPMDLLNEYINDLVDMRIHHFNNVWQQYQFMLCKANLQSNQLIVVQDFARNFVMDFQDEPQTLHWDHDQVF